MRKIQILVLHSIIWSQLAFFQLVMGTTGAVEINSDYLEEEKLCCKNSTFVQEVCVLWRHCCSSLSQTVTSRDEQGRNTGRMRTENNVKHLHLQPHLLSLWVDANSCSKTWRCPANKTTVYIAVTNDKPYPYNRSLTLMSLFLPVGN